MEESHQRRFVAGVSREDMGRLSRALADVRYPAQKWQLIDHAVETLGGEDGGDRRVIQQLWALPPGCYHDFTAVLAGVARTARGHPRRPGSRPVAGRHARPAGQRSASAGDSRRQT